MSNDIYQEKMQKHLHLASTWLIEEGVKTFAESGKEGLHRKLVDEWGVLLWVDPWIEAERYIDGFWIKARGINHEVINVHRETLPSGIYEFWIVKVDSPDDSTYPSRSEFYITRTDRIDGQRTIVEQSDQFIARYDIDGTRLVFPIDNRRIIHEIQPWLYPENYQDSLLKDTVLYIDTDGNIKQEEKGR